MPERWCSCVIASPKHSGTSNPNRSCHEHLPKSLLVTVFGSCQEFAGKQTLRSAWDLGGCLPTSHGGVTQRSWSCWNNQSQGQVAPGNLALILHLVTLHPALMRWVSYSKNVAWPKENLEVLTVSSELALRTLKPKWISYLVLHQLPVVRMNEGLKKE